MQLLKKKKKGKREVPVMTDTWYFTHYNNCLHLFTHANYLLNCPWKDTLPSHSITPLARGFTLKQLKKALVQVKHSYRADFLVPEGAASDFTITRKLCSKHLAITMTTTFNQSQKEEVQVMMKLENSAGCRWSSNSPTN